MEEQKRGLSLAAILDDQAELALRRPEPTIGNVDKSACVECQDTAATLFCQQCQDQLCQICFATLHRKGTRLRHVTSPIQVVTIKMTTDEVKEANDDEEKKTEQPSEASEASEASESSTTTTATAMSDEPSSLMKEESSSSDDDYYGGGFRSIFYRKQKKKPHYGQELMETNGEAPIGLWWGERPPSNYFIERAKYCPLRLELPERKMMRLTKAVIKATDYTGLDNLAMKEPKRVMAQIKIICATLTGIALAVNYPIGQARLADNEFKTDQEFFRVILELGRRHKIRNPEKWRSIYARLIYLLQDSQQPDIAEMLDFTLVKPVRTVYDLLQEKNALALLEDKYLPLATGEILPEGKTRPQIDKEIRMKDNAIKHIAKKFARHDFKEDEARLAILSIADNHAYLRYNRDPCDSMIKLLQKNFHPTTPEDEAHSLAIYGGENGARLTHSHEHQYSFVLQTLTLWKMILHDMYRLWFLAEEDLLDPSNKYVLEQTGQGCHRVQQCPRVSKAMRSILHSAQQQLGTWVGSSVIHLGDANVPNSLMFIDKYNQVARILCPVVTCLRGLPGIQNNPELCAWVKATYGSIEGCELAILRDFFRSAFDGSGADNFFSAGSCIDGRLTSAWNWCSQLQSKPFYSVFLMTGFIGFDGKFWEDE